MDGVILFAFIGLAGFIEVTGRYVFVDVIGTRNKANNICKKNGLTLVQIETESENAFILDFIRTLTKNVDYNVWIGLRFSKNDQAYEWSDREITTIIQVPIGELSARNFTCVIMSMRNDGIWLFADCIHQRNRFVCEYADWRDVIDLSIFAFERVDRQVQDQDNTTIGMVQSLFRPSDITQDQLPALSMSLMSTLVQCLSVCNMVGESCVYAVFITLNDQCSLYGQIVVLH